MPVSDHLPFLAPGLRVVARGRDHLQVGLYDDRRVLLPRTDAVEQTLGCLLDRRPVGEDPGVAEVLRALDRAGCLSRHRPGAVPVAVLGGLAAAGLPDLGALFAAKGVPTGPVSGAGVVLVLSEGELDRDRLDPLIRRGTSHLVVRLVDGGALLGPFVVPGATACLRCIDAAHSVRDPDHVPVTSRYVRATAQPRSDGVPDLDLATAATAVAWAARDVIAFAVGHEPSTWSRTWHLRVEGGPVEREWSRDPLCGCCWPADALTSSPAPVVAFP